MLYVQQSLGPDEELIHVGRFHWMYTFSAMMSIFWGFFFCIAILVGALYLQRFTGFHFWSSEMPYDASGLERLRALNPYLKFFAFLMFVMGLYRFAHMMVIKATTEIAITNNRLVYKTGLLARYVGEISIDRIEGVNLLQGILGRLLNYGRVMIRGMGVGELVLPPIEDPVAFRKAIEKARST